MLQFHSYNMTVYYKAITWTGHVDWPLVTPLPITNQN